MVVPCADTNDAGKWNACLPGCRTFEEFRFVMIVFLKTISPLSCSVAMIIFKFLYELAFFIPASNYDK